MMIWQPSSTDLLAPLRSQNPWHYGADVPAADAPPRRRPLASVLWKLLMAGEPERYQLVIGPRRVGKTVAMHQTVQQLMAEGVAREHLWWLHLAHPLLMRYDLGTLIRAILEGVASSASADEPVYFFLDELTYSPDWDLWLKTFFDERWPIRLVGTSSSSAALRQGRIESGVGRWDEQYLSPCLFTEYLHLKGKPSALSAGNTLAHTLRNLTASPRITEGLTQDRERYTFVGGFPELLMQRVVDDSQPSLFGQDVPLDTDTHRSQRVLRSDAIQKAVYQDIPQIFGVQNPINLERLLYTIAGQMCGLLAPTTVGCDVGLTSTTVEKYINYLERSHIVFLLPNYAPQEETVQRRGRKVFFVDSAVRNAALQRGTAPLQNPPEMGLLMENLAASHLFALAQQTNTRLYYWRDQGGRYEVDLVYDHPEEPLAFEIGSAEHHKLRGLKRMQERFSRFTGQCYLVYPDAPNTPPTVDGKPGRISLDAFLVSVDTQSEAELLKRVADVTNL